MAISTANRPSDTLFAARTDDDAWEGSINEFLRPRSSSSRLEGTIQSAVAAMGTGSPAVPPQQPPPQQADEPLLPLAASPPMVTLAPPTMATVAPGSSAQALQAQPQHHGWFWSFVDWMAGRTPTARRARHPVSLLGQNPPRQNLHPSKDQPFPVPADIVGNRHPRPSIEDVAQQTAVDGAGAVYVGDEWSRMAEEDVTDERRIRGEDLFLKQTAETPGNKSTYNISAKRDDVPEAGSFWRQLEHEDKDIQQAFIGEQDLTKYHKLTRIQDEQVVNAVSQMERPVPAYTGGKDNHTNDLEAKIHEPWPDMEAKDRERERKIHADPFLRMIQEKDVLRRKKWH